MHLPHLRSFKTNPVIFLTTCVHQRRPLLDCIPAHEVLREVWAKSPQLNGWHVGQYLLMPDHVHLFVAPEDDACALADWMRLWKSIAAGRINRSLNLGGTLWQPDYFDRYLRSMDDYESKWDYIAQNPVRKGLVGRTEDWPFRGVLQDLKYHASRG